MSNAISKRSKPLFIVKGRMCDKMARFTQIKEAQSSNAISKRSKPSFFVTGRKCGKIYTDKESIEEQCNLNALHIFIYCDRKDVRQNSHRQRKHRGAIYNLVLVLCTSRESYKKIHRQRKHRGAMQSQRTPYFHLL